MPDEKRKKILEDYISKVEEKNRLLEEHKDSTIVKNLIINDFYK